MVDDLYKLPGSVNRISCWCVVGRGAVPRGWDGLGLRASCLIA